MKQTHDQFSSLFPLVACGIILLLLILIYRSYVLTGRMQPTIILPGGVTYTGK